MDFSFNWGHAEAFFKAYVGRALAFQLRKIMKKRSELKTQPGQNEESWNEWKVDKLHFSHYSFSFYKKLLNIKNHVLPEGGFSKS
jgi:hypothetical protein